MRKFAAAAVCVAALAGAAAAVGATTWPSVKVTPTVKPSKAGTPKHPQGVKLTTTINWQKLGAHKQPIVTKFLIWFPKGSLYQGGKFASCSKSKIAKGPSACPKASIMGSGSGTAYASQTTTHPKITVVNGGAKTIYFYTVLNNPARVRKAVVGTVTKSSGKYAYELSAPVPKELQVVAGTPIELTALNVKAGKGAGSRLRPAPEVNGHSRSRPTHRGNNSQQDGSSSTTSSVKCTS